MKRTIVDRIDVLADGTVMVRFAKQTVVAGEVIESAWHRTVFVPGISVDDQMREVNAHLDSMGCAPVTDYEAVRAKAAAAHTPERVAAYRARVMSQQAASF